MTSVIESKRKSIPPHEVEYKDESIDKIDKASLGRMGFIQDSKTKQWVKVEGVAQEVEDEIEEEEAQENPQVGMNRLL